MRMDVHAWTSMDVHGYPWMSMDIHGYIHGYPAQLGCMSMNVHGVPHKYLLAFKADPTGIENI